MRDQELKDRCDVCQVRFPKRTLRQIGHALFCPACVLDEELAHANDEVTQKVFVFGLPAFERKET
jgi:hypothetical protein